MQTWTRLAPGNADSPSLLRDKDGVLHVVWRAVSGGLLHAAVDADGKAAGIAAPVAPAATAADAWLVPGPERSLQILFKTKDGIRAAVSKDGGAKWEDAGAPRTDSPALFSAASDKDGKPLLLTASGSKLAFRAGDKEETVHEGDGCCIERPALVLDAESAEGWAAWHSSAVKAPGLFVKAVKPSTGKALSAPGSRLATIQRLALSPRLAAPGVYLAYVAGYQAAREVKLWNVRGGEAFTVAKAPGARAAWLAPAPEGRFWILWLNANNTVSAVRTNKALLRFSRPYALGGPGAAAPVREVAADASKGPLDAIAGVFHTRLLPELELKAAPDGVRVSDLGDPVEGAQVEIEGKAIKTDAKGLAAHPIPAGATPRVTATMAGYAPATLKYKLR